jgi:hypothetical protein
MAAAGTSRRNLRPDTAAVGKPGLRRGRIMLVARVARAPSPPGRPAAAAAGEAQTQRAGCLPYRPALVHSDIDFELALVSLRRQRVFLPLKTPFSTTGPPAGRARGAAAGRRWRLGNERIVSAKFRAELSSQD